MKYLILLFCFSAFANLNPSNIEPNQVRRYGQGVRGERFKKAWREGYNECRVDLLNAFYFHTSESLTRDEIVEVIDIFKLKGD